MIPANDFDGKTALYLANLDENRDENTITRFQANAIRETANK